MIGRTILYLISNIQMIDRNSTKLISKRAANFLLQNGATIVNSEDQYEIVDSTHYARKVLFLKTVVMSKYKWFKQLLTPWEYMDFTDIVENSLWKYNHIDPYILEYELWKSKRHVQNVITALKNAWAIHKIWITYYVNPYIYLYWWQEHNIKKWWILDQLYKHFDNQDVYWAFIRKISDYKEKKNNK